MKLHRVIPVFLSLFLLLLTGSEYTFANNGAGCASSKVNFANNFSGELSQQEKLVAKGFRVETALLKTVIHHSTSSRSDEQPTRDFASNNLIPAYRSSEQKIDLKIWYKFHFVTVQEKLIFPFHFFW